MRYFSQVATKIFNLVLFTYFVSHLTGAVAGAAMTCPGLIGGFGPIQEGGWVTAYEEERPTGGRMCRSEMRVCRNGFLTGFYRYANCREDLDCNEYPFGRVANGSSVAAFRTSLESGGRKCQKEMRYCSRGRLTGSFTYLNCTELP